ncbi:phage tail protein [Lacinutrix neustonica]|uniref:Phage tail protein n=1 Tax=Lacinutrix neustonica TaxID=2980107 RepID=A0A9E8MZX1_9FLAO|nr:phage tail protein [Lacinutrix neustonica]WAC03940.1 phage tail protein [Lacinutrix neustonica]
MKQYHHLCCCVFTCSKKLVEGGQVAMQWELKNTWPTKITSTDLKSDGNEVAVDTLEMAHEQLIITNGS